VLGLQGDDEVAAAFGRVTERGRQAVGDGVDVGALVSPMRHAGVELLVSVTDAGPWGTLLTIGVGGIWVEVLGDATSALLPVDASTVKEMLVGLKASALLTGGRGRVQADLDAIVDAVMRITVAATSLGAALHTLEVNPLLVDGPRVEVLDALAVTYPRGGPN
jgi:hypothetical protein